MCSNFGIPKIYIWNKWKINGFRCPNTEVHYGILCDILQETTKLNNYTHISQYSVFVFSRVEKFVVFPI